MSFKPSKYQSDIFHFLKKEKGSLLIRSVAGSGKTTTILESLNHLPITKKAIFLSFNSHIAKELKGKVPSHVRATTIHSFGCNSMYKYYGKYSINPNKIIDICVRIITNIDQKRRWQYYFTIQKLVDLYRQDLANTREEMFELIIKHNIDLSGFNTEKMLDDAINVFSVALDDTGSFDFTDMVYVPAINPDMELEKFDVVFVDEVQDLNIAQHKIVNKIVKKNGRIICVGDEHQCQPKGTIISLPDGEEKNIEDLKIGDHVVSNFENSFIGFRRYSQPIAGKKILDIKVRQYNDLFYTIKSEEKISSYTYSHKCLVRLNDNFTHIVYLMRKGKRFRIGRTQIKHNSENGFSIRLNQEQGDDLWVIKFCESAMESAYHEAYLSHQYAIPQLVFREPENKFWDNNLEKFYDSLGNKLFVRANILLKNMNMKLEFPFITKNGKRRISKTGSFIMEACNLKPKYFKVCHYNNDRKGEWKQIDDISIEYSEEVVYSLKVEDHECYVADGILTHNSIYGFAGADSDSFNKFAQIPGIKQLPLSVCYRCSKRVVEEAQKIVPHIEWSPYASEGKVGLASFEDIKDGDWVLCRNTKPLVVLCIYLIKNKQKAYVKGDEMGKSMIHMLKTLNESKFTLAIDKLKHKLEQMKDKLYELGVINPEFNEQVISMKEKISIIRFLGVGNNSVTKVLELLQNIFKNDKQGIQLSTIHRVKGLENDKVFILCPELMPSKYAIQPWQQVQEQNLRYVAITRAKDQLYYITDYNRLQPKNKKSNEDDDI